MSARAADFAEGDFSRSLKWSALGHFALICAVVLKSLVFPGSPAPYHPVLKVDLVGLPDQLKSELKAPSKEVREALKRAEEAAKALKIPRAEPKTREKPAEPTHEMVLHPKRAAPSHAARDKKLKSALDRIKALEKIKTSLDAKVAPVKGNRLSKGSSLAADAIESDRASYYDELRDRLRENWTLPVWISRQNYSARVELFIDGRGRVRRFRFLSASGNEQFDNAVKRAINDSEPYPVPPPDIRSVLLVEGVEVGFPL